MTPVRETTTAREGVPEAREEIFKSTKIHICNRSSKNNL
jgi:hypothetical protein